MLFVRSALSLASADEPNFTSFHGWARGGRGGANPPGTQRVAEKQVSQRYWRAKVYANSTNTGTKRLAGVTLLAALADRGWRYDDGRAGPPTGDLNVSECYPYTAIVGAPELGYDERPTYKRKPASVKPAASFKPVRAAACDSSSPGSPR